MALYNAGFPATYPQMYSFPTQNQQNGIIWVQGEAGAKSYLVAPNNTVQLWDSESQTIYLKSADASGMPSMKVLDYSIRETARNAAITPPGAKEDNSPMYATKGDIERINGIIDDLKKKVSELTKEAGNE